MNKKEVPMTMEKALEYGYYFDRCIDLVFYNSEMEPIAKLNTPKRGLKPTITIKGILIEGGYSIDSYISIQNMAFDVDIAYVNYIKARMYYSGFGEAYKKNNMTAKMETGHVIMYKVLYADQEKEPPNRCVRFQCVVAAKDYTLLNTKLSVSGGTINYLENGQTIDNNSIVNKSGSETTLKKLCEEIIKIYNKGISSQGTKRKVFEDDVKISYLEIEERLENKTVQVPSNVKNLKDLLRNLNSLQDESSDGKFSYAPFKIVIDRGRMRVTKPLPDNWQQVAQSEGYSSYDKYYTENYEEVKVNVYSIDGSVMTKGSEPEVIPLNFVKSATRSECLIYVETMFDDRITPGCKCSIKSNAIMGKRFGSKGSQTKGSRILNYAGNKEPIIFRNTGKIEYLFSTTEDSYMKLQGPVDGSVISKEVKYSNIYDY